MSYLYQRKHYGSIRQSRIYEDSEKTPFHKTHIDRLKTEIALKAATQRVLKVARKRGHAYHRGSAHQDMWYNKQELRILYLTLGFFRGTPISKVITRPLCEEEWKALYERCKRYIYRQDQELPKMMNREIKETSFELFESLFEEWKKTACQNA